MTTLASVTGEDFCQFEYFKLPLEKLGLTWLGGINNDTTSASSNGSGKTNLLKSIGWCLFEETVENEPADDVIRNGCKATKVTVKTVDGWKFVRERRRGAPKFSVFHDGKPYQASKADLQSKVIELVGYDWRAYLNCVMYAARDSSRFLHPRTSDAERKAIIHRIMRTDEVGGAHEWIKNESKKMRSLISLSEGSQRESESVIKTIDLNRLKERHEEFEERRAKRIAETKKEYRELGGRMKVEAENLRKLKAKRKEWRRRLDTLQEKALATLKLRRKLVDEAAGLSSARKKFASLEAEAKSAVNEWKRRHSRYEQFVAAKVCPQCTSPLDKGDAAKHLAAERDEIEKLRLHAEKLGAGVAKEKDSLEFKIEAFAKLESAVEEDRELQKEIDELDAKMATKTDDSFARELIAQKQKLKGELSGISNELNPFEEEISAARRKLKKALEKRDTAKLNILRESENLAYYEFWKRGYGPSGMPSYMLDEILPALTERTNHWLDKLSDGDINMNFTPQRALQTKGEIRDEIGIGWEVEGVEQKAPSGGQWRKMEIATDLGFLDMAMGREGNCLDLLALDEILDGLDPVGRQRLVQLLHSLRGVRGTIFVISHDSDIAEVFERSVTVTKENGVSSIEVR